MTSCIDAFDSKEGLIIIEPEEIWLGFIGFLLSIL